MEFLTEYGMFLAKAVTLVFCILIVFGNVLPFNRQREEDTKGQLRITKINERYEQMVEELNNVLYSKKELKAFKKQQKQDEKAKQKADKTEHKDQQKQAEKSQKSGSDDTNSEASEGDFPETDQNTEVDASESAREFSGRIFLLSFTGDVQAKATSCLREEITAILSVAKPGDQVLVGIESPGGVVHGYGLAASQLERIKKAGLYLTVAVDKVAASGGYMMACVADRIIAAPFAVLGSVGVVAQMPNFHRLLNKNDIDIELHTAGEHKRTLTTLGENTEEGRRKFIEDLEDVHDLFKTHVQRLRPQLDIEKIATGEVWFGTRALDVGLVDELMTSDEFLQNAVQDNQLYDVKFELKKSLQERLMGGGESALRHAILTFLTRSKLDRFF